MAKSAPAPAPEGAAPTVTVQTHTRSAPAPKGDAPAPAAPAARQAKVIMWDNDAQGHRDPATPGEQAAAEATGDAPAKAEGGEADGAKTAPVVKPKEGEEGGEGAPAKPPTAGEKRAALFDKLEAQRQKLQLETALKAKDTEHAQLLERFTALEGSLKGANLGKLLELAGVSEDDALEALMRKDPAALARAPKGDKPQEDPRLAELVATVKALKEKLDGYERQGTESKVAQALAQVEEMSKDIDIPVTRAVENGFELVLRTAHELWQASGQAGKVGDYVPDAAARAEAYFREKRPALAALADQARGGRPKPKDEGGGGAAAGIGRRAAARPDAKEKSVWSGKNLLADRSEVDEQIKREAGLIDKDQFAE